MSVAELVLHVSCGRWTHDVATELITLMTVASVGRVNSFPSKSSPHSHNTTSSSTLSLLFDTVAHLFPARTNVRRARVLALLPSTPASV